MNRFDQTRREALIKLAAGSLALSTSPSWARITPNCVLTPEQTEGPYFVDMQLQRSDIRSDPRTGRMRAGLPLQLQLQVTGIQAGQCRALPGAIVDIWHCDAAGVYSEVSAGSNDTTGQQFLRGYQITDQLGKVNFVTIYPGWYPGRAIHIHFKVRTASRAGKAELLTSQLYFDEAVTQRVYHRPPYAQRATGYQSNERDGIYRSGQGQQLLLRPEPQGQGYVAVFGIGLMLS